jgi:integrase
VRGEFGTPKSKRSTRTVPIADEVAGWLERLFQHSRWQGDDDLVFAPLATGGPAPERERDAPNALRVKAAKLCTYVQARAWRPQAVR